MQNLLSIFFFFALAMYVQLELFLSLCNLMYCVMSVNIVRNCILPKIAYFPSLRVKTNT